MKPHLTASKTWYPVLRRAVLLLVVTGFALAATGCGQGPSTNVLSGSFVAPDNQCGIPPEAEQFSVRVLEMVNEERANSGLAPLTTNAVLADIAADYACEMAEGDFFDHVSPVTGSTVGSRALEGGYSFRKVGENLAGGQTGPEQVMAEWMASSGHQANILDRDFVELGIAVRTGGSYGWYWVQEFGLPR